MSVCLKSNLIRPHDSFHGGAVVANATELMAATAKVYSVKGLS